MKSFKEPYIYDVHTERGLVISPAFADSIVFKSQIYCSFLLMGSWGVGSQNWSFFVKVILIKGEIYSLKHLMVVKPLEKVSLF